MLSILAASMQRDGGGQGNKGNKEEDTDIFADAFSSRRLSILATLEGHILLIMKETKTEP